MPSTMAAGATNPTSTLPVLLHTSTRHPHIYLERAFAAVFFCAILALLRHHAVNLLSSTRTNHVSFHLSLLLLVADTVLAFQWVTAQTFRLWGIRRHQFLENLEKVMEERDFPAVDVVICTADPYKEPPIVAVNTALSVMAYDYPSNKVSVYLSDDGGSELTLFAFMEAAKFAGYWLPFCRTNRILETSPEAYFASNYVSTSETRKIKEMYENMRIKIENVVGKGKVDEEYLGSVDQRQAINKWSHDFTGQDHPTLIQVLLVAGQDKDLSGHSMPNLVYVTREKRRTHPHHFKAGALNTMLRVSAVMTNAPIVLTLDCDMWSNDPQTLRRMLCYFSGPTAYSSLGYIQFPQMFRGLDKDDIYGCEHKFLFQVNPMGFDGILGPNYVGTGCFFNRRAFFGGPSSSSYIQPEISELNPYHIVRSSINSEIALASAYNVASCNYEEGTLWGQKLGFRYGSVVEDYYTGYRLQCEGWRSIFCSPERPAFMGDAPTTLIVCLSQSKRWMIGLLEVLFSKRSPIIYGVQHMGLMGLGYSHYAFWPTWSIPLTIYAFVPQLSLLHGVPIFPTAKDPSFLLYIFLFLGAYLHNLLLFVSEKGAIKRWWNSQRIWMITGVSSFLFASFEFCLKSLGMGMSGFSLTSKVQDEESNKRYEQGMFEFGVSSPMFVPVTMAAIINLLAVTLGPVTMVSRGRNVEELFMQLLLCVFITINCWPVYEAMVLRTDKGRMPPKITVVSTCLVLALCLISGIFIVQP